MSESPQHSAEVLVFQKKTKQPMAAAHDPVDAEQAVADLAQFEGGSGGDDYRHRMLMNAIVFIVSGLLIAGGIWLAIKIADLRKTQDCVLSGRRNCAAISVPQRLERY